jgi:hypothetical protein
LVFKVEIEDISALYSYRIGAWSGISMAKRSDIELSGVSSSE